VVPDDFTVFLQKYDAKKFEGLYMNSWGNSSFDADYTLVPLISSRGRGYYYKNPTVDAAIYKGRRRAGSNQAGAVLLRGSEPDQGGRALGLPLRAAGSLRGQPRDQVAAAVG